MKQNQIIGMLIATLIIGLSIGCTAETPAVEEEKPVIKLVQRGWLAFELNNMLAKIVLEEKMGYPVEIRQVDGTEQFTLLAAGEAHANLEIWSGSWQEDLHRYIGEEKTIEHAGELGVLGKIGWFVPAYILEQHPELETWEGLKKPELAQLFSTPETGDKGRYLTGDVDWVDYDADIIKNLGLPLQIEVTGSEETLLAEVEAAYANQAPILFYLWTPHYIFAKLDLTPIQLPPYSDECYAKQETGGIDCGYPTDVIVKAMWPGLKEYAPEAYQFVKNINFTNEDQISMLAMVEIEGLTVEEAARRWMEQNEITWEAWIP